MFVVHRVFVVHDEDHLIDDEFQVYLHLIRLFSFHIHFEFVQVIDVIHIVLVRVSKTKSNSIGTSIISIEILTSIRC